MPKVLEKNEVNLAKMGAKIFTDEFKALQDRVVQKGATGGGTTLTACVFTPDRLTIAHVGDTRAVMCSEGDGDGKVEVLTLDHRATTPEERRRLVGACWERGNSNSEGLLFVRHFLFLSLGLLRYSSFALPFYFPGGARRASKRWAMLGRAP